MVRLDLPTLTGGDKVIVVETPAFAESIADGDIIWNKGLTLDF